MPKPYKCGDCAAARLWPQVGALAVFGVVVLSLSVQRFHKQLEYEFFPGFPTNSSEGSKRIAVGEGTILGVPELTPAC